MSVLTPGQSKVFRLLEPSLDQTWGNCSCSDNAELISRTSKSGEKNWKYLKSFCGLIFHSYTSQSIRFWEGDIKFDEKQIHTS